MLENIWYELDNSQKITIAKYATVFVGGVAVGFAINKLLDSSFLDDIKEDSSKLVDEYLNYAKESDDKKELMIDDVKIEE
ncbi:MAG: hypothetical protein BZ135_04630 [Methanosphaera sp. rholeuAM6]|nr:MAG: hypothetical protein BZ135_04630 [Methanosphaera sp. rholeuAM6]